MLVVTRFKRDGLQNTHAPLRQSPADSQTRFIVCVTRFYRGVCANNCRASSLAVRAILKLTEASAGLHHPSLRGPRGGGRTHASTASMIVVANRLGIPVVIRGWVGLLIVDRYLANTRWRHVSSNIINCRSNCRLLRAFRTCL